jgi:hypothetical protein
VHGAPALTGIHELCCAHRVLEAVFRRMSLQASALTQFGRFRMRPTYQTWHRLSSSTGMVRGEEALLYSFAN